MVELWVGQLIMETIWRNTRKGNLEETLDQELLLPPCLYSLLDNPTLKEEAHTMTKSDGYRGNQFLFLRCSYSNVRL